ncbi:MAG: hypothetical protein P4L92_01290 [Rudaea sp.]|nr:hypothetical protein [Rudaea sp.]
MSRINVRREAGKMLYQVRTVRQAGQRIEKRHVLDARLGVSWPGGVDAGVDIEKFAVARVTLAHDRELDRLIVAIFLSTQCCSDPATACLAVGPFLVEWIHADRGGTQLVKLHSHQFGDVIAAQLDECPIRGKDDALAGSDEDAIAAGFENAGFQHQVAGCCRYVIAAPRWPRIGAL